MNTPNLTPSPSKLAAHPANGTSEEQAVITQLRAENEKLRELLETVDRSLNGSMDYEHSVLIGEDPANENCLTPAKLIRRHLKNTMNNPLTPPSLPDITFVSAGLLERNEKVVPKADHEGLVSHLRQQLTHLKAELERANELLGNVLGEGRVGHAIWNDIAAHLNPKKTP